MYANICVYIWVMDSSQEMENIRAYREAKQREKLALAAIPQVRRQMMAGNGRSMYSFQSAAADRFPGLRIEENAEMDLNEFSFRQWLMFSRIASELPEEERLEWEAAREKTSAILGPIIEASYGLIVRTRLRLAPGYRSLAEDLDAEGVVGVIRALERFDPDSGNTFPSYCSYWITAMMLRAMEADQTVRIPEDARALRRKAWELIDQNAGIPRWDIAATLGVSEAKLDAAMSSVQSLDAPVHDSDGSEVGGMEEILVVDGEDDAITEYDRKVLMDRVERIALGLDPDLREGRAAAVSLH